MRASILLTILIATGTSIGFSNNILPAECISQHKSIDVLLDIDIINTEEVSSEFFYYDIVGLEKDATAEFLTSGVTKNLTALTANLKLNKTYVKIGIKLKWSNESRYFLFDRNELTYGMIDLLEGKE